MVSEIKETHAVEFPSYCIMNKTEKAMLEGLSESNQGISRNACVGCGIYSCFGNPDYKQLLEEAEQRQVDEWKAYISEKIKSLEGVEVYKMEFNKPAAKGTKNPLTRYLRLNDYKAISFMPSEDNLSAILNVDRPLDDRSFNLIRQSPHATSLTKLE